MADTPLTNRKQQVADLIADGLANKEIAEKLGVSLYTIKTHTKNIYDKWNIHSKLELSVKIFNQRKNK